MNNQCLLIINTFLDVNWLAPLIFEMKKSQVDFQVWIVGQDLRKPDDKLSFSEAVQKVLEFPFMRGVNVRVFKGPKDFGVHFKKYQGVVMSVSTTFLSILLRWKKPKGQRWVGFSFFGEADFTALLSAKYFVGSEADAAGLPADVAELPLPYYDVFNREIAPGLSDYSLEPVVRGYEEVIVIPYITDSLDTWFMDSYEYVKREMRSDRLFIFKYRKKNEWLKRQMEKYREIYKKYPNVVLLDRPYFDLTSELMKYATKVVFTRKMTQFIKECFFSRAQLEVLERDEKISFYKKAIGISAYDMIFDDYLENKEKARKRHIHDLPNSSCEALDIIGKLGNPGKRESKAEAVLRKMPWSLAQRHLIGINGCRGRIISS
jgi:hypothetical protein